MAIKYIERHTSRKENNTMAVFTNQATLSYNNVTTTSNVTVGEIVQAISATKTATPDVYGPGNTVVTFVVTLINSGTEDVNGLTLTDDLGAYTPLSEGSGELVPLTYMEGTLLYYVNGVLQPTPTVTATSPLTITGINVPADGSATVVYQTVTNEYADKAPGSTITSTTTVAGAELYTSVEVGETISVNENAMLTISKSLSPTSVVENGTVTYTFVINNYGNTAITATDDAVVTDTFTPALTNLAATFNGAPWTAGNQYTYDAATGAFATIAGQITVPAATVVQDETTGAGTVIPGSATLVVTGTV